MTTQEKLNSIVAKCRAFLEIAEKRTPGEWHTESDWPSVLVGAKRIVQVPSRLTFKARGPQTPDTIFIAACAGQAEAMARSTIATVKDILEYWDLHKDTQLVVDVLAAWPEEIL